MSLKFVALLALSFSAAFSFATVRKEIEPVYAEAVIAFHNNNFSGALIKLDELPPVDRNCPEALEIRALALKGLNRWADAGKVLERLLSLPSSDVSSEKAGLYQFNLGVISYYLKDYSRARKSLDEALYMGSETSSSHYFLGLIDFQEGKLTSAESHFLQILASRTTDLIPITYMQLGNISAKQNDLSSSVRHFSRARKFALATARNPDVAPEARDLAEKIISSVTRTMTEYDATTLVADVGLATAYDSNVSYVPASSTSPAEGISGRGSIKQSLFYGLAFTPSSLSDLLFVAAYRGSGNYNLNRSTRTGQFLNQSLSVFLGKNNLHPFSFGVKLEGIGAWRYGTNPSTGKESFRPYSLTGSFGPFLRWEFWPRWNLGFQIYTQPSKFFQDGEVSSDLARSGSQQNAQLFVKNDRFRTFWNPGASLSATYQFTNGSEYRNHGFGAEFNDTLHLSDRTTVDLGLGIGFFQFPKRSAGERKDTRVSLNAGLVHRIGKALNLVADLTYQKNTSNVVDTYQYNRYEMVIGANYRF